MLKFLSPLLATLAVGFASLTASAGPGPSCAAFCDCTMACTTPCSAPGNITSCGGWGVCRSVPKCKPKAAAATPLELLTAPPAGPRLVCTAGDGLDLPACDPAAATPGE
jgi:hypothetical protein